MSTSLPSLSLHDAQHLFNEIINDSSTNIVGFDNTCLISGNSLGTNSVTLPCGHKFDYIALLTDLLTYKSKYSFGTLNKCPYCRQDFLGVIPYRPDISNKKVRNINTPVESCFEKNTCSCVKEGKHCVINATIPIGDKFACFKHYKSALKNYRSHDKPNNKTLRCQAILKSGKSKGNLCGAIIKDENNNFCKRHLKA